MAHSLTRLERDRRRLLRSVRIIAIAIALAGCGGGKAEAPPGSPTSMLGIKALDTPAPFAAAAKLDPPRGTFVLLVDRGSLAEKAGIKTGDIILTYDGIPVASTGALLGALARTPMGSTIKITFWRDGAERALEITFAPSP
jgi:S1-C subfamily serine protease